MIGPNEGSYDRIFRGVGGLVVLAFGLSGMVGLAWSLLMDAVGLMLLITAAVGYCPLYKALGFDTLGRGKA